MKIETITYKRVKNLGNYENETFQATATVTETDNPETAAKILRQFVNNQLYPPQTESEPDPDDIPFDAGATAPDSETDNF
ncbi:hypothetical protein H6G80_03200 [Nostoc sp. FACHB-87]|uniref:hypothetical protein n=1 Tax=Nostocaceae TaxID=1162 RepID=UPI001686085C|nr:MULTISPECIES: hypothetical protein [Nostocaceae]MBD2416073.1 hypothetical protein [Nostoc calcicola FACHB-3891]MBD2453081.1 hypothetical protein [Nostoc sp. FACHB-87]MBD2475139.1 hypothetical protein [Anabaena sp. FACHB-83]